MSGGTHPAGERQEYTPDRSTVPHRAHTHTHVHSYWEKPEADTQLVFSHTLVPVFVPHSTACTRECFHFVTVFF